MDPPPPDKPLERVEQFAAGADRPLPAQSQGTRRAGTGVLDSDGTGARTPPLQNIRQSAEHRRVVRPGVQFQDHAPRLLLADLVQLRELARGEPPGIAELVKS